MQALRQLLVERRDQHDLPAGHALADHVVDLRAVQLLLEFFLESFRDPLGILLQLDEGVAHEEYLLRFQASPSPLFHGTTSCVVASACQELTT